MNESLKVCAGFSLILVYPYKNRCSVRCTVHICICFLYSRIEALVRLFHNVTFSTPFIYLKKQSLLSCLYMNVSHYEQFEFTLVLNTFKSPVSSKAQIIYIQLIYIRVKLNNDMLQLFVCVIRVQQSGYQHSVHKTFLVWARC